jgi:ADP-heptose:LPS heptosyltransferase
MGLRKKIGTIRQAIVWSLARHIGAKGEPNGTILRSDVKRILVTRPNHRLGNLLLITPLLQEIEATFPDAKIDLFVKGTLAHKLFARYRSIDKIIALPSRPFIYLPQYLLGWIRLLFRKYDLVINAAYHSSSGRLSTRIARARFKTYGDVPEEVKASCDDYRHNAKHAVYSLRDYVRHTAGVARSTSPLPQLDLRLTALERKRGRSLLQVIVPMSGLVISIFTYATGEKRLSCEWWQQMLAALQARFAASDIVEILPMENVSQVDFAVPAFYSRDVREIGAVIANTDVFIGADSGIMHLASAAHTPVVGLFSVTDPAAYGPYGNGSMAIDTNHASAADCVAAVETILQLKALPDNAIGGFAPR